jgi:hypothetical protein
MNPHDPTTALHIYRPQPPDIEYSQAREASNCDWCRWGSERWCHEPTLRHTAPHGECRDVNPRGECPRYSPTRWTKLLRRIGLRAPAWLPEETDRG